MPLEERSLIRAAGYIRDQVCSMNMGRYVRLRQSLQRVLEPMQRLKAIDNRLAVCISRRWTASAESTRKTIEPTLNDASFSFEQLKHALRNGDVRIPSLREVFQGLIQADEEFGNLAYDPQDRTLSVTTKPIELEGVYLGPFEIKLHIPSLGDVHRRNTYSVVALTPNPASSDGSITHPHVSDERVCEGDASVPIQSALSAGRICDFFQIVNSVLTHYNPDSPYVPLDNWNGIACYECGFNIAPDYSHWCHSCQSDFCDECASCCVCCDETTCLTCLKTCPVCEDSACPLCMVKCPECGLDICVHCVDDEACPCHHKEEEDDECEQNNGKENGTSGNKVEKTVAQTSADASVYTDGVGQVAVLQGPRAD